MINWLKNVNQLNWTTKDWLIIFAKSRKSFINIKNKEGLDKFMSRIILINDLFPDFWLKDYKNTKIISEVLIIHFLLK